MLDTNIALDFMLAREPHYRNARKLMLLGYLHELELWMSGAQINDLLYLLTKGGNSSYNGEAQQSLKKLCECVNMYGIGKHEIDAVLDCDWQDLEDACLFYAAKSLKAHFIITRNTHDFVRSSIKVFDADQFFEYLAHKEGLTFHELEL